ncbi:MAG: Rdx family protein [Acidobacteria bacterium]|nr:Rdx family protein [Acidobacteriota bacterium]
MPRASSLAAAIKQELGVEAKLVRGKDGIFDVSVNDELIFSKHETGRFPDESEVIASMRKLGEASG